MMLLAEQVLNGLQYGMMLFLMAAGLNAWSGNVLFSKGILSAQTAQKAEVLKQLIEEHYYKADEVTDEQLEEGIYKGMLEALDDPYSVYYTTEEVEKLITDALGNDAGVLALTDEKGRRFLVQTAKVAYVEIGAADSRRVGFGIAAGKED